MHEARQIGVETSRLFISNKRDTIKLRSLTRQVTSARNKSFSIQPDCFARRPFQIPEANLDYDLSE